jgi:hypothetical protein
MVDYDHVDSAPIKEFQTLPVLLSQPITVHPTRDGLRRCMQRPVERRSNMQVARNIEGRERADVRTVCNLKLME